MNESEKSEKQTTFKKVENGMIFQTEDGETIAVGLPSEVEELTAGEGKAGVSLKGLGGEVKGERYRRTKYDWYFLSQRPIPPNEMEDLSKTIMNASGTIPSSLAVSVPVQVPFRKVCPECRTLNPSNARFCFRCDSVFDAVLNFKRDICDMKPR